MLLSGGLSIAGLISKIIVVLIAMDIHEYAHARVAYEMGDSTARDMGKMTLDPRANINWIGFAMFVLVGFGILGSAPVNEGRMRNRRQGMLLAVAAGPFSNLILAAIAAIPFQLGLAHLDYAGFRQVIPSLNVILTDMVTFNLLLFLFNLIPLFPLDGWTVVAKLLPPELEYQWRRYQQYSMFALLALVFVPFIAPQFNILGLILGQPLDFLSRLFLKI